MDLNRRQMLMAAAALPVAGRADALPPPARGGTAFAPPDDEAYWAGVAGHYDVVPGITQLENGNWGMMAKPVLRAYEAAIERVNRETSYYARRGMGPDLIAVQKRVAAKLAVAPDEIAFTRNATEALKALIGGYNRLRPGDAVLYADLDYDSMQACCDSLKTRRGVDIVRIALPEPATHQGLIDCYAAALDAHPRVRLILLTHLSHRTGLVIPVREIIAMARARGVDAIVDAAHSWGQLDFALPDLDADFVGLNLHKWIGAPLGVGALYIRRDKLDRIDPDMANAPPFSPKAQSRVHTGTVDFAAQLSVPAALDFQDAIGDAPPARSMGRTASRRAGNRNIDPDRPASARRHHLVSAFRQDQRSRQYRDRTAPAGRLSHLHGPPLRPGPRRVRPGHTGAL